MTDRMTKFAAALLIVPLFFLGMNLANEITGATVLVFEAFFQSWLGTGLVVLGPFAAVALVLLPAIQLSVDHRTAGPLIGISVRLGRFQLLVLVLALLTGAAFAGYAFVENFTPRSS